MTAHTEPTPTKPTPKWDTLDLDSMFNANGSPTRIAIHAPIMRGAKVDWRATAESLAKDLMEAQEEAVRSARLYNQQRDDFKELSEFTEAVRQDRAEMCNQLSRLRSHWLVRLFGLR